MEYNDFDGVLTQEMWDEYAKNFLIPIDMNAERLYIVRSCLIWTLNRVAYKKSGYFDVELERTRKVLATPAKVIEYE